MGDNIGIPSESIDRVTDFIDDLWDGVLVIVLALIEMLWDLFVAVFIDITPALGFSLVLAAWLYMFQRKYIEDQR